MNRYTWLDKATLESVVEVNEQLLTLLCVQCAAATPQAGLLREVGASLMALDASSLRRAAASTVLLADAGLADARAWSDAIVGAVNERPPQFERPFFTVAGGQAVMRLVLTQAWHLARSEPAAARLLLGMSGATVAIFSGCTLSRLMRLAETRSDWLRPRWENRPKVWIDLLRTAGEGETGALERMRIRGLQLLAADARQG